ncbi:MAG: hypothetical protein P8178_10365 [Candidatus Thiodiazotropha sp.]
MSREKIFRINLPTLFEQVNARRKEQGLPSVEPAVMAVRASIKFAITRQKHMDLKGDKVNLDEGDADALCQALGELFNVDMQIEEPAEEGSPAPTAAEPAQTPTPQSEPVTQDSGQRTPPGPMQILPLFQFYAAINRERRKKGLQPVEPAVISVRSGIKFSIMRRRTLNFREHQLMLDVEDLKALDEIVAQQFDASIPGGVISLCKSATAQEAGGEKPAGVEGKGLLTRLFGRFGRKQERRSTRQKRHYKLDTRNLLLSIITRRAYLGHKPMTPEKIRERCSKALSVELELEVDMDGDHIALSPEHLDAFAETISKEFQIMFEDLDDLLGSKSHK